MKIGRYEDALVDAEECLAMAERLKTEFGEDYATVVSKFFLQIANVNFILKKSDEALDACGKGLELCKQVNVEEDLEIRRSVNNARRDMLNIMVRIKSRQDKSKSAQQLRTEMAAEHGLDNTFMPK